MKTIVLTQARLNSKRLPLKVLKNINKKHNSLSVLQKRISYCKNIDSHIFIVPKNDYTLISYFKEANFIFEVGSENNLMERHLYAAKKYNAETIIRITSDCPFADPELIDHAIEQYYSEINIEKDRYLYISNHTPPEESDFPNGSDVEIFSLDCLEYISTKYRSDLDREHVTFPMWDGRESERIKHIKLRRDSKPNNVSRIRITLDNPEDLEVLKILADNIDIELSRLEDIETVYNRLLLYNINSKFKSREGWV